MVTVGELEKMLRSRDISDEIIVRDKKTGKQLHNVDIVARKKPRLGCLFG
jgi:hypothetical protein